MLLPCMKGYSQGNTALLHLKHSMHSLGLHHYSINSLLYIRTIQDKFISLYRELISQLCMYSSAIRILVKGYLCNTLITPDVRKTL